LQKKRKPVSKTKVESGPLTKERLLKLEDKLTRKLETKPHEEMLERRFKSNFTLKEMKDMEKRIP
jgi:hypothetical protein